MASSKPKIKSIKRDKKKYTITWDKKATYEKQDLDYRLYIAKVSKSGSSISVVSSPGSWHDTDPGAGASSKAISPDMSDASDTKYYDSVEVRVRSKEKGKEWSGYDTTSFYLDPPPAPTVSISDNTSADKTVFGWEVKANDTNHNPYDHCVFYTTLVTNNTFVDGQQVTGWTEVVWGISPSATATSGTVTFQEATSGWDLTHNTYTRWFKAVSIGPGGDNPVAAYSKRTYSANNKPIEEVETETEQRADGGYTINVRWETTYSEANPIDSIEVEYVVVQPNSTTTDEGDTRKTELSVPPGTSFTKADTKSSTDVKRSGTTTIVLDSAIPDNNVVFVRVNTVYEGISKGGTPYIPPEAYGKLTPPSGLVVGVPDPETRRVGVTATNNTGISASFIGVFFRSSSFEERCIGIIPYEQSGQEVTVTLPTVEEDPTIVVRAYVADYSPIAPGAETYTISNIKMQSTTNQGSGSVPKAPASINVTRKANSSDTAIVSWSWTWTEANTAEISWSQDKDAWKSNNEPSTYIVKNTHSGEWYISGLSAGSWYFRVRLIQQTGENTYYGAYSDTFGPVKISEAPATPRLTINPSNGIVTKGSTFTCYWVYASGDGTPQASAMLYEVDIDSQTGAVTPRDGAIKTVTNEQYMTLSVDELGWSPGTDHYIAIRVTSLSGESSEGMSAPVKLTVANPLDVSFDTLSISLEEYSYQTTDEHGDPVTVTVPFALRSFPLTIGISGVTSDMTTTLTIEKENYCSVSMPNEKNEDVYDGELIYTNTKTDGTPFVINSINDLFQRLDDRESYRIIATIQDAVGQKVEMDPLVFQVFWDEQPNLAVADVEYDNLENVAYITPIPTSTPATGAVCDIYRLSVDSPELIVRNAEYYQTYVDPYPTLGIFGGYRIVSKSKYNDWITDDGTIAWTDYTSTEVLESLDYYLDSNGDLIVVYDETKVSPEELDDLSMSIDSQGRLIYAYGSNVRDDFKLISGDLFAEINDSFTKLDLFALIIDFDKNQLILPYDIDISNTWTKDFEQTAYLGGMVVGDWNKAVTKSTSINLTIPIEQCQDDMRMLTRLAEYPGACHVRTPDGSSYYANVSVKENKEKKQVRTKSTVSLEIARVDSTSDELDGLTYEAWIESKEE